ncbi:MAG: hypothetical protein IKW47_03515 [Alistipes sp.]|nr:hypothetical protein [Alistipes sp.]
MKTFNRALCAIFAFVVAISLGACTDPGVDGGSVKVTTELTSTTPTPIGAEVVFATQNIKEIAYMVRDTKVDAPVIFQGGKKVAAKDGVNTITITGLESETLYTVFFAFRNADDKFVDEVVKVEFLTTSYGDSVLTVVDRMYDGFKVHIQVPDEVKAKGHGIRYSTSSMPMYNYAKMQGSLELDMLLYNAAQYTTKDKLVIYDEYNSTERDENGNLIYDENGNLTSASFADPKVPGEPGYFLAAEFAYMDDEEERVVYVDGEVMTVNDGSYMDYSIWWYPAGWKPGYYMPMYDWKTFVDELDTDAFDSEKYWSGYYERIYVETLQPQIIENGVDIKVTDKTPKQACITFTPSDDILQYCYLICTESEYETQILPILENNEEHLRWFVGSYFAMMSFGVATEQEPTEQWLTEWFNDTNGMAGQTLRVMVAGLANGEGTIQSFDTLTFTLPEITLPKPVVEVTPVKTNDPYNVTFNIKNPDYATNPISEAMFACNYAREFDMALTEGYTSLLKSLNFEGSPNVFSKYVIDQINTAAGFDFTVPSRDAATTRLAVLAYNWEGSGNNPDEPGSPAVAENTTPNANYPTRVESELFDKLQGEWIASAPMKNYVVEKDADGNSTGNYTYSDAGTFQSPVSIMGGLSCPSSMPEEVWAIYKAAGISRDKAEELYDELVELTKWYNNRTRGFNRLLCLGFNFADAEYLLDKVATPYDLFIMKDYSVSQVSYMFYDFGPKWNLEIDEQGKVWLPINIELEYPLEAFNFGLDYTLYMLAVGEYYYLGGDLVDEAGNTTLKARFPVEVSADYNTITIKPIEYTDPTGLKEYFYPCVAQLTNGKATPVNPRVKGDIVLKRNTTGKAVKANAPVANGVRQSVSSLGKAPVPMVRPQFSMTPMENIKPIKRNVLENKIEPGIEAYHERATAAVKAYFGAK